ncbi:electron transfer flavoprotein subunit alpha/FixB family protein [Eubacterium sp. 1001713B170207_170306_E7]|uniref:electron transfer flavoprotein subunit alpha/FixB family protein n=1 Tax=Eubacterium sp. 1001713B170207_170306_E7 TaxID=2787097 RepID=UPI00189986C2|nr:electron transfer flavoprotein subunit alpha/FixB family protein [Eubacterium sp. 1001713B170207_170306_E7]
MSTALIYLQEGLGGLHPVCAELAAKAGELAGETAGVLICAGLTPELRQALRRSGLRRVYLYSAPDAGMFCLERHRAAVTDCVRRLEPEILLFGATLEGRSLAPTVGAAFRTGVTADCTGLELNREGQLVQTRPAFGGRIMASILTKTARPQIATVRQGVFKASSGAAADCEIIPCGLPEAPGPRLAIEAGSDAPLPEQERRPVVVAVGGGLRDKADLALFEHLAERLDADLMCSRVLVERGFLPQSRQIGLSGSAISAELLLCFGISGSVQFLSGVKSVGRLCAVNEDRDAEIMKNADYPVLGDLYGVARAMLEAAG